MWYSVLKGVVQGMDIWLSLSDVLYKHFALGIICEAVVLEDVAVIESRQVVDIDLSCLE